MFLKKRRFKTYHLHKSILPCLYPLLKRFYSGSIYVVFGIVTALNMSAMLCSVSLLYLKDRLYTSFTSVNTKRSWKSV